LGPVPVEIPSRPCVPPDTYPRRSSAVFPEDKQMDIQPRDKKLKPNPFTAYRDPETGKWTVVKSEEKKTEPQAA
jgi:hypothetical protein